MCAHKQNSVEALRLAHRRFDVERANVLPILLEKRDEKIDAERDVRRELIL